MIKPFKYPKRSKSRDRRTYRPTSQGTFDEGLTGLVQGEKASDNEERLARALKKRGLSFIFQVPVQTKYTLPDQEKQVDFVISYNGIQYPLEAYGERWHSTVGDKNRDDVREAELNEEFSKYGWHPLTVVWSYETFNQELADKKIRELFP